MRETAVRRNSRTSRPIVYLCIGIFVIVAAGAAAWFRVRADPGSAGLRGANVLLVTIDTLRADRLGAYGSSSGLTPTLDALARRGARFTRAWSHVPITLPAHASILTGLLPLHHGVRNNGSFRLGAEPATLAGRLRAAGYRTGAFVGAFVLDARFGLNRGFDNYDDRYEASQSAASFHFVERPADRVLHAATTWIVQQPSGEHRPWFAWVHLFDPHAPYHAPAHFAQGRAPYDAEVAWTDSALGAALGELDRLGQLERTIVIVTADHGESLGDHGETTHGLFAYDATLRVPLIIAVPNAQARVVNTPASHVDIVPTLLDLLAIEATGPLDGRSRRDDVDGRSSSATPIYFESLDANLTRGWAPLSGIVSDRWKYIELPDPELYDLDADPSENTNVLARESERVRELQSRLRQWTESPGVGGARPVDAAEAAKLRSLGYVTGSATARTSFTVADDPKRLVGVSEAFNTALDDFSSGHADEAMTKFAQVLSARPDFLAARLSAATALTSTGGAARAVELLRAAPESQKASSPWLAKMGQALAVQGNLRDARKALESAVAIDRGDPEPLNELGVVLIRLGEPDAARRAFEQLLAADPTATGTWFNLALLELGARNGNKAAVAFRHVVELDPKHLGAWRGLGAVLAQSDPANAAEAWRHAVELEPRDFDTLYNLGVLLADSGRPADAVPYLRRFLSDAPRDRYARDLIEVRARLARAEGER